MGKRRWRRVRLVNLAAREVQEKVLKQLEAVQGQDTAPDRNPRPNDALRRPGKGDPGKSNGNPFLELGGLAPGRREGRWGIFWLGIGL